MKQQSYTVRFLTPAFLGNADQVGQWRTPPFKALLRQWWRLAVAQDFALNVNALRRREAELFGVAADGGNSNKSQVRLRLDNWSLGTLQQAPDIGRVIMGKNQIAGALYSGFGPVVPGGRAAPPRLKANAALQAGAEAQLRLAFPDDAGIEQAMALMNAFGTVGGRSRNGWGSFELLGDLLPVPARVSDWQSAMRLDWPHTLGKDEKGQLLWQSAPQARWEDAMKMLAQARADMRRAVPDRLMLAYPDTKGSMPGWSRNDRVPHSIRFKVRSSGAQFVATIFHVPCRPADELWNKLTAQKQQGFINCYSAAHGFLDRHTQFSRVGV